MESKICVYTRLQNEKTELYMSLTKAKTSRLINERILRIWRPYFSFRNSKKSQLLLTDLLVWICALSFEWGYQKGAKEVYTRKTSGVGGSVHFSIICCSFPFNEGFIIFLLKKWQRANSLDNQQLALQRCPAPCVTRTGLVALAEHFKYENNLWFDKLSCFWQTY